MDLISRVDVFPLWSVLLIVVLLINLSIELGYFIGRRDRQKHEEEARKLNISTVVGASLGLLAFILAFTFGATTSRFDDRKSHAIAEVNAIGTTYLRTEMLPEAAGERSRTLLRDYTTDRFGALMSLDVEAMIAHRSTAERIQAQLWAIAMEQVSAVPQPTPILSYAAALNELIDVHQQRFTVGAQHRMPPIFWSALFILTILTMVLGGYDSGVSGAPRRSFVNLSITLAFATVLILVVGLDRPTVGSKLINEEPYLDLHRSMGIQAR